MQNVRELAASFILSCDPKDLKSQLKFLDEAKDKIPEQVEIWNKFENDSLQDILSYIEDLEGIINRALSIK